MYDVRGPLEDWHCKAWLRGHVGELRCRRAKLAGSKRCALHGSKTMRSQIAAERTILLAANPAAAKLMAILDDPHAPYNAVVTAARDLLDRAQLSGTTKIEHTTGESGFEVSIGLARLRRGGNAEPPVSSDDVIDAEVLDAEPVDLDERVGAHDDGGPVARVSYDPRARRGPAVPPDLTPNGPGTAFSAQDMIDGTAGSKAMLRAAREREGRSRRVTPTRFQQ